MKSLLRLKISWSTLFSRFKIFIYWLYFFLVFSKPISAETFVICTDEEYHIYSRIDGKHTETQRVSDGTMGADTLMAFKISDQVFEIIDGYISGHCRENKKTYDDVLNGYKLDVFENNFILSCEIIEDDDRWHRRHELTINRITGKFSYIWSHPTEVSNWKKFSAHKIMTGVCEVMKKKF